MVRAEAEGRVIDSRLIVVYGLLGFGNIGQEAAKRAHAFGMPLVVWSRRFATGQEDPASVGIKCGHPEILDLHLVPL